MKHNFLVLIAIFCFAASCSNDDDKVAYAEEWSYDGETGPDYWAEIEQESECGGAFQSPVDILQTQTDSTLQPLDIHYDAGIKISNVVNNGHTVQFNFESGNYITLNGEKYELKQFHFHELSEHTVGGVHFPMEIHLVHVSDAGKYAVLGVLTEESATEIEQFDFLDNYLPLAVEESKTVNNTYDINKVLPAGRQYFTYTGSLTTPPCTEAVQWFIFKTPVEAPVSLIEDLRDAMPAHNYRPTQPLNGRIVKESV
ncbi:carbonic anhydrase family protein [Fulvivirga ulvae]|uniref:carbonic anhydrase n=1 Tax=Fulvivirga ulvae TaxID=2904245 RepID=UPI001F1A544A|nr:carbonic anhydrase family protein [Fulvivirga ulvae]UII34586.1 carbonic anhydrase family protein [Fulvivirga ulvae]